MSRSKAWSPSSGTEPQTDALERRRSHRLVQMRYRPRMDDILPELPTLVSLSQTLSVSRTARDLGVPRSTISRRLARLERALGVALAERTTRSFRLTDEGRMLASAAAKSIAELRTAREQVQEQAGPVRGWLRVCTPPGLAGPMLGRFLMAFHDRCPEVRLQLTVREHVPHLLDEPFDVVLALGPLRDAPWVRHRLGELWYLPVANPEYLAARGTPTSLDDLPQHDLCAARSGDLSTEAWPTHAGPAIRIDPHFVTGDLGAVVDAARAGMGIALVPIHHVVADLLSGNLVPVLADEIGRHIEVYMLYLPERRDSPLIRALLESVDDFGALLAAEMPTR